MCPSDPKSSAVWGPILEPELGAGHDAECLMTEPLPMGSGYGQPEEATLNLLFLGLPPVQSVLGGGLRQGHSRSKPGLQKLALGMWNVTALMGK